MGEEVGAGIDEDRAWFIVVIALFAARVATGAGPGGGGVFGVDGDVSAAGEVGHAHLAPGRERFAGFGVGDGASGAAELGAVDARFEGTFVCRDNGQTEHGGSVGRSGAGCNKGFAGSVVGEGGARVVVKGEGRKWFGGEMNGIPHHWTFISIELE